MPVISRSSTVPYTAEQMFDLVDDVDRYKEFLPWCVDSQIVAYPDPDAMKARVVIAKGGIEKAFTTLNRRQRGKMIEIRLIEGPFHRLEGYWRFRRLGDDASRISLDLEFEFSSRLMRFAFGTIFTELANRLVHAFVERAESVYGRGG